MSEKEKKYKNADEPLETIKNFFDYNKEAQKIFYGASKVDKGKSKPNIEESIAERAKLRRHRSTVIKEKEQNININLLNYYFSDYQNPSRQKVRKKTLK